MPTPNINSLIRRVIQADPTLTDPHAITDQVLAIADTDDLRDLLAQTLVPSVRMYLSQRRSAALKTYPAGSSKTVAAIRDWASIFFATPVMVSEGIWKHHSELSAEDLDCVAAIRGKKEAENARWRDFYEKAAAAVREHGADKFGAIDPAELAELRNSAGIA